MEYEINPKKIHKLTVLPSEIKKYINEVSGESLKVLLMIFSEENNLDMVLFNVVRFDRKGIIGGSELHEKSIQKLNIFW